MKSKFLPPDWNEIDELNFLHNIELDNLDEELKIFKQKLLFNISFDTIEEIETVLNMIISFYKEKPIIKNILPNVYIDRMALADLFLEPISEYCLFNHLMDKNDVVFEKEEIEFVKKLLEHNFLNHMKYIQDYGILTITEMMNKYNQPTRQAVNSKINRLMGKLIDIGIFDLYEIYDKSEFYNKEKNRFNYVNISKFLSSIYYKYSSEYNKQTKETKRKYKKSM